MPGPIKVLAGAWLALLVATFQIIIHPALRPRK
jgi:hypothetical protein